MYILYIFFWFLFYAILRKSCFIFRSKLYFAVKRLLWISLFCKPIGSIDVYPDIHMYVRMYVFINVNRQVLIYRV